MRKDKKRVVFGIHKLLYDKISKLAETEETSPSAIAKWALLSGARLQMDSILDSRDDESEYTYYSSIGFDRYKLVQGKRGASSVKICMVLTNSENETINTIYGYSYDCDTYSNLRASLIYDYLEQFE